MKFGDKGDDVAGLQQALVNRGANISVDGIFGNATEAAVCAFQLQCGLVADGIVGAKTQAALSAPKAPWMLSQNAIAEAAQSLGVDVSAIMAVNLVESLGSGFLPDGRPKILFERHHFYRLLKQKIGEAEADRIAAAHPDICNKSPGGYKGNAAEYPRLARAMSIDQDSAQAAASWGKYQIMGFNYAACGFTSVGAYVEAMQESEDAQLAAFVKFVGARQSMKKALKDKNWAEFARLYNGPNYGRNAYDSKLAHAERLFAGLNTPAKTQEAATNEAAHAG